MSMIPWKKIKTKYVFEVDKEKASLNGVSTADISRTIALALEGQACRRRANPPRAKPREARALVSPRRTVKYGGFGADLRQGCRRATWCPCRNWAPGGQTIEDKTIYHRQLERVVYVTGEMAGRPPVETILDITRRRGPRSVAGVRGRTRAEPRPLESRTMFRKGGGIPWAVPSGHHRSLVG